MSFSLASKMHSVYLQEELSIPKTTTPTLTKFLTFTRLQGFTILLQYECYH